MKLFKYLFVLLSLLSCGTLQAATERFSTRIENATTPFVANTTSFSVYDSKYSEMTTDLWWSSRFTNVNIRNKVTLGLNKEVAQTNTYATGTVRVEIKYQKWNGTAFALTTVTKDLVIKHSTNEFEEVTDLSSYTFTGGQLVTVKIISMTVTGGTWSVNDFYLEAEILVDRNYQFDGSAVDGLACALLDQENAGYVEFSWQTKAGAEFYELEWVHVHDYTLSENTPIAPQNIVFNFYLNSTRIVVKGNHYRIPNVFDRGYIVFRVRAVGLQGAKFNLRKEGVWTVDEAGHVLGHPAGHGLQITQAYGDKPFPNPDMNWAHQVGYTEDGKRAEAVSFADGLGRGRQSVAHNTATKQAVVSNVYYDELGRAVISDLATPVDGEELKHFPNFNLADGTSAPYQAGYFEDAANADTCHASSLGFSTASGAGKYYSPQNPDRLDENANIPDAQKFPFSRVTYLNDYTGRVLETGGAGPDLRIGGGHESRYEYVSANQIELDRLFGSEVGYAAHYQKLVTLDENGQAYMQYSDMAGRVVASYMAGAIPQNLDSVSGVTPSPVTTDLILNGRNQSVHIGSNPYSELSHVEYISAAENFTFNYGFTPQQFSTLCTATDVCLDCVYDLVVSVEDACGGIRWRDTILVNGEALDNTCAGDDFDLPQQVLALEQGAYTVYKKLSINQQAKEDYWCMYLEDNSCIEPVSSFFETLYARESFADCTADELGEREPGDCAGMRELMLLDMRPGGQYGGYNGNYTATDPLSFLNTSNALGTNANWRYPEGGAYRDAQGNVIMVLNDLGASVPVLDLSLREYILKFESSWSNSLLKYHPEYCFLTFCESSDSSRSYDQQMRDTYTFEAARDAGLFRPLRNAPSRLTPHVPNTFFDNNFVSNTTLEDPFFFPSGLISATGTAMNQQIVSYITIGSTTFSMWEYALILSANPGPLTEADAIRILGESKFYCNLDIVWMHFRDLYLTEKATYFFMVQQDQCNNDCIGAQPACTSTNGLAWSQKASRWGNLAVFGSVTGQPQGLQEAAANALLDSHIATACNTSCTAYAEDWIAKLAGCGISTGNTAALKAELIALCVSGCDSEHPMGASTNPNGQTINDVLANYLPAGFESNLCSELLISDPRPFESLEDAQDRVEKPLDVCACDYLYQAELDYNTALANETLPENVHSKEEMLALQTGVSLEDIDQMLCKCAAAKGGSAWTPGFAWPANANQQLSNSQETVPANLSCNSNCISCEAVNALLGTFHARFSAVPNFATAENYKLLLTNYLNDTLGFSLTYTAYEAFIGGCNANGTPYCTTSPLAKELSDVINLLAFRGTLLQGAQNPVNLRNENIVYRYGDLQDVFHGDQYWSTTAENSLQLHFGTSETTCGVTLELTGNEAFAFPDIISFGQLIPETGSCSVSNRFRIAVTYLHCGIPETAFISGFTDNCLALQSCYCTNPNVLLCDNPFPKEKNTCYEPRLQELYDLALERYEEQINAAYVTYDSLYNATCAAAFTTENMSYSGQLLTYQYTLFYYDQAGNLVKTIAPQGVDHAFQQSTQLAQVAGSRAAVTGPAVVPAHTFQTTYAYNSYNQPVSTTNPDQEDPTKFWYDRFGRLVASQNPVQAPNLYSYTLFDAQGRPVQAGQVRQTTALTTGGLTGVNADAYLQSWIAAGTRSEVMITRYDKALNATVSAKFAGGQQNLRLRVASVLYYESYTGSSITATTPLYKSATHYSYDLHGNVVEQLQEVPVLKPVQQDYKSTRYDFELLSGNVKTVSYQKGKNDYLAHSYVYDALNRLTEVYTTQNDVHSSREAHYRYYDYGPLARVETGEYQVQGSDYAYTINGWLKSMNAGTLLGSRDMGHDSRNGYLPGNNVVHFDFAPDVLGYTLGYFSGDYKAIGTSTMEPAYTNTPFGNGAFNLYNGNIRHTVTAIAGYDVLGAAYRYDQLNRLKSMQAYYLNTPATNNSWSSSQPVTDYASSYTYDKNGNLKTLNRNGTTALGLAMDRLTYQYGLVNGQPSNRLTQVTDAGTDFATYDDIRTGMAANNYKYNKLGQLVRDAAEGIDTIQWYNGSKKVKRIVRNDASSPEVVFEYNPFGQRILKIEKPRTGGVVSAAAEWTYTYYVYDAGGATMAMYSTKLNASTKTAYLTEQQIYGAGSLGIIQRDKLVYAASLPSAGDITSNLLGKKRYQLTNHLGNVNVVITDRKLVTAPGSGSNYVAVVILKADYYPFGMDMKARHNEYTTVPFETENYRFGYNGMEKDSEIKGNGNSYTTEFRQYDPRLGRWLSLDPLMGQFPWMSPYVAFDNNPVYYTDPLGLSAGVPGDPPLPDADAGSEHADGPKVGSADNEVKITAYKSKASPEYTAWSREVYRSGVYNNVTNEIYQKKLDACNNGIGRIRYGTNGLHKADLPDDLKEQLYAKSEKEAINALKHHWASGKSGGKHSGLRFMYWRARCVTTRDEGWGLISSTALDCVNMWMMRFTLRIGSGPGGSAFKSSGELIIEEGASFSASEIKAAQYVSSFGKKVLLRSPQGTRAGGKTSDLLVDGIPYDVFTPTSTNANRIISAIAKKNDQTVGIVLDLSKTSITKEQLGNILSRVNGAGAKNIKDIIVLPK